jgi:cytochrome-b5 reductase
MSRPTLAFPKTMLFSQQLTVTKSEQINHDTKRITFRLPGGDAEVSGVPAGCGLI